MVFLEQRYQGFSPVDVDLTFLYTNRQSIIGMIVFRQLRMLQISAALHGLGAKTQNPSIVSFAGSRKRHNTVSHSVIRRKS